MTSPRPTVVREGIGVVRLGGDGEHLAVAVVRRSWTSTRAKLGNTTTVSTAAPAHVEVRREPPREVEEPGAMSATAARRLAKLLGAAAERAAVLDRESKGATR